MEKSYEITLEISGSYAMWTRPDTGDCPVSYPSPTFSAVKGIFESVLWGPNIIIQPTKVEICQPIIFHTYKTNYGGPLRKTIVIKKQNNYQLAATVLINVCYKLHALVAKNTGNIHSSLSNRAMNWLSKTTSPAHAFKEIFNRRLIRGQSFSIPFLGWKEFVPQYVGALRESTTPCRDINLSIPSMLREVFPERTQGIPSFSFDQNIHIREGVMLFPSKEGYLSVK